MFHPSKSWLAPPAETLFACCASTYTVNFLKVLLSLDSLIVELHPGYSICDCTGLVVTLASLGCSAKPFSDRFIGQVFYHRAK